MAKTVKTTKKTPTKSNNKVYRSVATMPSLFALSGLLLLLCVFPWLSDQTGSTAFRTLQLSIALVLAFAAGIYLGMQVVVSKQK